jgi:membrane protein YqaA with SNARE-associated domain
MVRRITRVLDSRLFKQIMIVLGVALFLLSLVATFDARPFLRFGYLGIFIFNLFGAGTFLIIPLATHMNIFILAFVSALGMACNDSVSWVIGRSGDVILPRAKRIEEIEGSIHKYGVFALFFWSLIPFPYDLIGLIAGYLRFSYPRYIIPTFMGKFIRFILLGSGALAVIQILP